mmetsp:Transcript_9942/g.21842  ORF Transcript_9942/g.21842 Transcript_9942/m.21842 type:complete len:125 (+) Transcript_9942:531-905(+)|eukprot:CAMPEP_0116899698 /NCGR_PEP_ID=MMETSP0467-20121206/8206_1 /TAXON_ID=283647 /ORGANISM="Mesodinium pulex, Strain SPMC105" /LENGTH=124 /DNA_ID=CAMNT_0004572657 /DNA_START=511 /DNA_END=885 /DNA_ORIENTATION=-
MPSWVPAERHDDFIYLLSCLPELTQECDFNSGAWRDWIDSQDYKLLVPREYEKMQWKHKLNIIKLLKPTIFGNAVTDLLSEFLKKPNIQPPALSMNKIVKLNETNEPILLITSSGSDPSKEIEE